MLTDAEFFGGSVADLAAARDATALPVLRKDFTVSAHDVCDARLMGADAVLLIAAALDDDELARFHALAATGTTLIVSSHVMDEAGRCDRLLLLRDGQLLADSTPAELRADGRSNDLEEAFLNVVRAREEVAA